MTKKKSFMEIQIKRENAFWGKTIPEPMSGCLLWIGAQRPNGYGKFLYKRKFWIAHRIAWLFSYGSLSNDICVLHKCDNPLCMNPHHLFLGSRNDNNKDRENKGRGRPGCVCGEAHGGHKLSEAQVKEIRNEPGTHASIGKKYGVSRATIGFIKNRKNWRYL